MNIVNRSITSTPVTLVGNTLHGTAIPYNSLSHDLGGFRERFMPGSASESLKRGLIDACLYHDKSLPIGSQAAGTLRLREDERGLHYEVDLPDTSYVADFKRLMGGDRKDVGGTSFGFLPEKGGAEWTRQDGNVICTVNRAHIDHISPVITPAYPATSASLRSFGGAAADELYGIDLDKLAGIFCAAERGLALTNDEIEFAELAMGRLRSAMPRNRLREAEAAMRKVLI